ncbi:autotransporter outer membrane beta-barrel domain-containing protein [Buttiauxella sp. S19-1]|uniref:autotransporter outer membrane beta-barrel domain-containing protein n=1 Tax=Buttiauxella sp. S19-1 TaxID=941430 RepID=UPI001EDAA9D0|nr:autotransporter outer membrane beta-barrel domain-containing protein [Buttiauxella sp. S19-1]
MNDSNASVYVQNGATVSGDTGILLEENSASILNILGNGTVVSGITGIDSDGSTQINVDAGAAVTGIGNAIDLSGDSNTVNITNGATVTGDTAIMLEGGSTSAALNVSDSILNGTTNALDIASTDAATVGFTGSQVYGAINTSSATAQTINMNGSAWTGNATTADGAGGMTLALSNGTDWFGDVTNSATGGDVNVDLSSSSWKGAAAGNGSTAVNINLADASAWTNTSDSTVSDINMSGSSTLIMDGGNITTTTLEGGAASDTVSALAATTAEPVNIYSTYNAATGQAYILNAGTATGTFNAGVTSGTSGAAGDMTGNTIVHVTDASGATFNEMESDVGVYRYTSETVANADGSTSVVLTNPDDDNGGGDNGGGDNGGGDNGGGDNGGGDDPTPPPAPTPDNHTLSTAAQSVVNTRAAAVNLWRDEEEALNLRMDNERRTGSSSHPGNRGAWGSYYGGYHRQQMNEASTSYDQTNNGFMVGADNRFDVRNGNVLIGFAAMRGNGDVNMHDMGSAGTDIDSYGLSLYTSYRLNNGLFFDATIKGEHLKNDMDVVSTDGGRSQGHYSNSGYGGSLKAGYHWQATPAFWAEPYARVSYIRYNGVDYTLDNGMRAKDDNYSSVLVEGGANIGTSLTIHNAEVKPYLHLAVADETENGNSMDINGVNVNDSTDGAKGIVGLGADVKFTKNLGAYAGANYAKGNDNEDPWQLNAGVTWTW